MAAPDDDDLRAVLAFAAGPDGAWPRLPVSRRHDPALWAACRFLEGHGLVRGTGAVHGDRTEFRATEAGMAICAACAALKGRGERPDGPPDHPPKPRIRSKARPWRTSGTP
jgi:hypothetical protein